MPQVYDETEARERKKERKKEKKERRKKKLFLPKNGPLSPGGSRAAKGRKGKRKGRISRATPGTVGLSENPTENEGKTRRCNRGEDWWVPREQD